MKELSEMSIYELVTYVRNGTDAPISVGWKWQKLRGGFECKTIYVTLDNNTYYWQGHKNKDPEKLRKAIYKRLNICAKTDLF